MFESVRPLHILLEFREARLLNSPVSLPDIPFLCKKCRFATP